MDDYRLDPKAKTENHISPAERFRGNLDALAAAKKLMTRAFPRQLNPIEASVLAGYSGWGALARLFDSDTWSEKRDELQTVVTAKQYEQIRASVNTSYFTPPWLARAAWETAMYLGLTSGRVLDLGCGTGNFYGVKPGDFDADYTGVEIEPFSATIAKHLYPNAEIINSDIRVAGLTPGMANLVIGNVPFDQAGIFDKGYEDDGVAFLTKNLHTYFVAKAIDYLAPGGVAILIASSYFLDGKDDRARIWIRDRADLLGAVRLPQSVFRKYAGASVVTDLLIFRRRDDGEGAGYGGWVRSDEVQVPDTGGYKVTGRLNRYFTDHPQMMMGDLVGNSRGRFGPEIALYDDRSIEKLIFDLGAAVRENLQRDILQPPVVACPGCGDLIPFGESCDTCHRERYKLHEIPATVKDGAFYMHDGYLWRKVDGSSVPVRSKSNDKNYLPRIASMIRIRDAAVALLNANLENEDDIKLKPFQRKLLSAYIAHTNAYGYLNSRVNKTAFAADPDCALVMAIEEWDERKQTAKRRAIFSRRVVGQIKPPETADNAQDALMITLSEYGHINWKRMMMLTGQSREKIAADLEGRIFQEPNGTWVTADDYLSGEVGQKLAVASRAALDDEYFEQHVLALRNVMPTPLTHDEINAQIGAGWVDGKTYGLFLDALLHPHSSINEAGGRTNIATIAKINYIEATGQWTVAGNFEKWRPTNTKKWGTGRQSAIDIFTAALNNRSLIVRDYDANGKAWINHEETIAAKEKLRQMSDAFRDWLWSDLNRRKRLVRRYNKMYNEYVPREWDGSHLSLVGTGADMPELRPNQRNAAWRVINGGNTLLWHDTGAGKTLTMICAGMEMRRLGLRRKVVHVTLSNTLQQYAEAFHGAYPTANLLLVDSRDMVPAKRREMIARMATGDYDAILITQDVFNLISVDADLYAQMMENMIDMVREELYRAERDGRPDTRQIERAIKSLEKRLERRISKSATDKNALTWESIGCDLLFIDEAHNYKNLYFATNMTNVAGIGGTESGRAFEAYLKCQWTARRCVCGNVLGNRTSCRCVRNQRASGQVVLATATALSNTIAELYTWMRFLVMDTLIEKGMEHFDAWVRMFAEVSATVELKPSGRGHRINERLSKFSNMPELLRILYSFSDNVPDLRSIGIDLPKIKGDEPTAVMVDMSDQLEAMMDDFQKRAENLPNVRPDEDNILAIMSNATSAAVDARLMHGHDEPGSKINVAVRNIFDIWLKTRDIRLNGVALGGLTQSVFLDHGTPGGKGIDLYEDMRQKLVAMGVPRDEVAFIHEYKTPEAKEQLFYKITRGLVRVVIGGTSMMGFGSNFQALLYAEHEIDPPWRPSDVKQRRGRIVRPGNLNEEIEVLVYSLRGSFDAYRWQILEHKARFIHQIQSATLNDRVIEDVNMAVIDFAQMKALTSENPKVQLSVALEAEVRKLRNLRAVYVRDIREAAALAETTPGRIERLLAHAANLETAVREVERRAALVGEDDPPLHALDGWSEFKTHTELAQRIVATGEMLLQYQSLEGHLTLWGFDARIARYGRGDGVWIEIDVIEGVGIRVPVSGTGLSVRSFLNRVRVALLNVGAEIIPKRDMAKKLTESLPEYRKAASQPFRHAKRLKEAEDELEAVRAEIEADTKAKEKDDRANGIKKMAQEIIRDLPQEKMAAAPQ